MEQKEFIIQLIKDDLTHQHLINNFESIGFHTDDYALGLSETIFKVLEIDDENEELFELYLEKCWEKIECYTCADRKEFRKDAEEIYDFLMNYVIGKF
jgi:hypothetical protein